MADYRRSRTARFEANPGPNHTCSPLAWVVASVLGLQVQCILCITAGAAAGFAIMPKVNVVRAFALYTMAIAAFLALVVVRRSDSAAAVIALFVLPPVLGGIAALLKPSRFGLLTASVLIGAPALLSLIGGLGLLLLPPALVFLVVGIRSPRSPPPAAAR